RSEEHTSELQSHLNLVCRLLLEKKKCECGARETRNQTRRYSRCTLLASVTTPLRHVASVSRPDATSRHSDVCACFFFNDTATTEIYTLSLHDALPILYIFPSEGQLQSREGRHVLFR